MGTVKYSGPVASFHCPTEATIRSLKVHFSPKQEGSGTPSPENIREIRGWDGVVVHNDDGNVLPEEYQKVEYLESNGKQYLYTNIPIQTPFTVEADFMYHSDLDQCLICAGYNQDGRTVRVGALGKYKSNLQNYYAGYWNAMSISNNIRYKMRVQEKEGLQVTENNGVEVNRQTRSHNSSDIPLDKTKGNFAIFCMCRNGEFVYYCYAKLYSMTIWGETGTIVGKFIPCRRKSDNKPGMYDTVSGEFFTNQGTGEFICGPDIGETVEYEFGVLGKNKFNAYDWQVDDTCINIENANGLTVNAIAYIENHNFYNISSTKGMQRILSFKTKTNSLSNNKASVSLSVRKNNGETPVSSLTLKLNEKDYEEEYSLYIAPECDTIQFRNWAYAGSLTLSNIQLELGSTATAYEPYNPNHTVYGGWVDLISGGVQQEWHFLKGSDLTWTKRTGYNFANFQAETSTVLQGNGSIAHTVIGVYSNLYESRNWNTSDAGTDSRYVWLYINGVIMIKDPSIIDYTVEEFNEYVKDIQFVYILKEPITYHLAPTSMQTFLSTNNVWSNADYVEIEYDLHETQDILARKQFIIANQPHTVKASGSLVNFETDMAAALKECKVHFGPIQEGEGDPSPDNVRPITGWTGVEVTSCGKNLFDINLLAANNITISNGVATATATNFSRAFGSSYVPLNLDMSARQWTLTMTAYTDGNANTENVIGLLARFVYSDGSKHSLYFYNTNTSSTTSTITTLANKTPLGIQISYGAGGSNIWHITDIQLEPVLEATTYEPYSGVTIPIDWSDSGTIYGGYIDLVKGEVVAEQKIIDLGSIYWTQRKAGGAYIPGLFYSGVISDKGAGGISLVCDRYPYQYNSKIDQTADKTINDSYQTRLQCVNIHDSDYNEYSATEFRTAMSGVMCVYVLAEPIHYPIDNTTLKTLRGTNNVWSNANGNIELSYWKH